MFDWSEALAGQGPLLTVIGTAAVAYVAYHYGASAKRGLPLRPGEAPEDSRAPDAEAALTSWEDRQTRAVYRQRLGGMLLLGILPALIAVLALPWDLGSLGLGLAAPQTALLFTVGTLAVVLPVVYLSARRPPFWLDYPEIRARRWPASRRRASVLTWGAYLLAYEFFFRGFLLFGLTHALGPVPAVAITTLAYVYAHLPKYVGETVGTLPMGVLFAYVALETGGIWAPFLIHWVIAGCSDAFVLRANPALVRS